MTTRTRSPLAVAFVTVTLDLLGFGIIIPIQPFYAEAFGASPAVVTLLGAAYSGMQFLFAPMWGRLSDRVGRRPVILVSVAISVVGYVLFALADSLFWLFAARMLAGFGTANIGTAQAIVADVTTGAERARGMGLIGAAFGIGFVLGPALGGGLGQFGPEAPAFAAAALAAMNWVLAWRLLPETRPPRAAAPTAGHARRRIFSFEHLRRSAELPNVRPLLATTLVMITGMALMEQSIPLFIEHTWVLGAGGAPGDSLGHAAALTTWVLLIVGVVAAVIQGGMIGRLTHRYGERTLMRTGAVITAVALALIPGSAAIDSYPALLATAFLLACGTSLLMPSVQSALSRSVADHEQGAYLGLNQSLSALGRAIGPAAAGVLFEVRHALPFLMAAAFMAIAFAFTLRVRPLSRGSG